MAPCDRSAIYTAMLGKGMSCPDDARAVILRKTRGDVRATLCSGHIKAYRAAGIKVADSL